MPEPRAVLPGGAKPAAAAPASGPTPGDAAAEEAWRSLGFGEAGRVGVLGDSGCGKTEAIKRLIGKYQQRQRGGVVLVVDDKPKVQFAGQLYRDPDDLDKRPPQSEPRVIVFRGDAFSRTGVDPEQVAALQWRLAQKKFPSLVVYDELDRACAGGQWKAGATSQIGWAFGKGRSVGAASLWGTQETEAVPREAFNQSTVILCFRMMGNPVRLLKQRGYCEGGVDQIIPRLPGDELPPAKRGYFVLLRRGRPWDGRIYRFT